AIPLAITIMSCPDRHDALKSSRAMMLPPHDQPAQITSEQRHSNSVRVSRTLFSSRPSDVDNAVSLGFEPLDVPMPQSTDRRFRAELHIAIRDRLRGVRARLGSLLALMVVAGAPALAQTPSALQELEAGVSELKGIVDQAKKDSAAPNPIDRISTQVDKLR